MKSAEFAQVTHPCHDYVTHVGVFPEDEQENQMHPNLGGRICLQIDAGVTMLHLRPTIAEARELVAIIGRAIGDVEATS